MLVKKARFASGFGTKVILRFARLPQINRAFVFEARLTTMV